MAPDSDLTPPVADEFDEVLTATRGVLNVVPAVGGALAELLNLVIGSPLERRRGEWERTVAQAIEDLRYSRGINPETLRDDPNFIDAVLSATSAAVKTSREEKRLALRNAILNAALPGAPENAIQQMFIATVDRFTEWHLLILKLMQDPGTHAQRVGYRPAMTSSLQALIEQAVEGLRGRREFYDIIWAELIALGFVGNASLHTMMSAEGYRAKRTTPFGDQFLAFIEDPLSKDR